MSKKDIKRAQAGNPHRSDAPEKFICPFPNCGRSFVKEGGNVPDVCNYHRQFIIDYAFCIQHLTVTPKEPEPVDADKEPKLFIPRPGQTKDAIKQALGIAQRGKKP